MNDKSRHPAQFSNPDMIWLPLTIAQMAALASGAVLRVEVPAEPDEGLKPLVVMIRPPKKREAKDE